MINANVIKLVMITPENNNKFYIMTKLNDSQWEAQWGRISGELTGDVSIGQRKIYPIKEWHKTYNSKTAKGYTDVTHLYEEIKTNPNNPVDPTNAIQDKVVRQLMIDLQKFASISVKENYTISSESVTQKMIDEAQIIIDKISSLVELNGNVKELNNNLIELYKIIPRKMSKVSEHLVQSLSQQSNVEFVQKMIYNEQSLLDTMAGQVKLNSQKRDALDSSTLINSSLLDQIGITIEHEKDPIQIQKVKDLAGENAKLIKNIFKVTHKKAEEIYQKSFKSNPNSKEHLFWHGSRNQNWFNILQSSLLIRPAGAIHTGSMYGDGIYFADKSKKAMGYSSLRGAYWTKGSSERGYLALFKVNVGKQKHIYKHDSSCYKLTYSKIKSENCDSVFAHKGADLINDEFVIYKSDQCTISYLIELSN